MLAAIILVIIIIFIAVYTVKSRKEGFEIWPLPNPEELGAPTPPPIMRIEERIAKGEIVPKHVQAAIDSSVAAVSKAPPDYDAIGAANLYGGYGPGGYGLNGRGVYGGFPLGFPSSMYGAPRAYGALGMYGVPGAYGSPYLGALNPLAFGGNTSGSTSIGGFGPASASTAATPSTVRGSARLEGSSFAQGSLQSAMASVAGAGMGAPMGVPMSTSSVVPSAVTASSDTPIASSGKGVRTKTLAEEADIKGFDWAGAAARAATAFEPQTVESSAPALSVNTGSFDTLAASGVLKRDIISPNVTASTAVSLPTITLPNVQLPTLSQPTQSSLPSLSLPSIPSISLPQTSIDTLSQQKIMQATFGSVPTPGLTLAPPGLDTSNISWNTSYEPSNVTPPVFASANSTIRGSRYQPGSMPDSKSTSTVVDTAPGQVAVGQSVVGQMAAQLQPMPQQQPGATTGPINATTTTSAIGA